MSKAPVSAQAKNLSEPPLDRSHYRRLFDVFMVFCRANSAHTQADHASALTAFHSVVEPGVSLADYMLKLDSQVKFGDECIFVAFLLIGRYSKASGSLPSALSAHRLCVAAMRLATKLQHDLIRSNRTFARFGGLQLAEMNYLESQMVSKLHFNLWFTSDEYEHVRRCAMSAAEASVDNLRVSLMADAMGLQVPNGGGSTRLNSPDGNSFHYNIFQGPTSPACESLASPSKPELAHFTMTRSPQSTSHRGSLSFDVTVPPTLVRRRTSSISTTGLSVSTTTNPIMGNGFVAARLLRTDDRK